MNTTEPEREGADAESSISIERTVGFTQIGPAYHPLFDKFESEHITQFLSQTHDEDQQEQQIRKSNRWFRLGYVVIGVLVFVFLTWFLLPAHPDLYLEILKVIGIFAAGIGGGYGIRAYQERHSERAG